MIHSKSNEDDKEHSDSNNNIHHDNDHHPEYLMLCWFFNKGLEECKIYVSFK